MNEKLSPVGKTELTASWLPLVIIVIAQLQMGININALPVSLGPIIQDLKAPATAVSTAIRGATLNGWSRISPAWAWTAPE